MCNLDGRPGPAFRRVETLEQSQPDAFDTKPAADASNSANHAATDASTDINFCAATDQSATASGHAGGKPNQPSGNGRQYDGARNGAIGTGIEFNQPADAGQ